MNARITLFNVMLRKRVGYINPDKLRIIKRVYDRACAVASIPSDDFKARNALAEKLITASATISITDEYETLLMAIAHKAVGN
jgi:hypothetical protein